MSAMPVQIEETQWSGNAPVPLVWSRGESRSKRWLPTLMGLLTLVVDIGLVAGAYLLAYAGRFAMDDTLPTLSFDRYVRLAVMAGVLTSLLLAMHGLYRLDRPKSWPIRMREIISSSSTALVLAITASFFLGDQAFSRLWLAAGCSRSSV